MSRRGTKTWTLISTGIAVLGLAVTLVAWPTAEASRVGTAEDAEKGPAVAGLQVESFIGKVEIRQPDGKWIALKTGQAIHAGAVLRTGAFSRGVFRTRDGSTLAVKPNSFVTVGADHANKRRFVITEGRIAADIPRREGKTYEFAASKGDARAETRGGRFQVVASREGLLGVATEAGRVDLIAQGERVTVSAGKQAVALPGASPSNPIPIPAQVFLRVKWPEGKAFEEAVVLAGTTTQGSKVRVEGSAVEVRPDGSFERRVHLSKGENHIVVIAEDLSGRIRRMESPTVVRRDEQPKVLKLRVRTDGNIWE